MQIAKGNKPWTKFIAFLQSNLRYLFYPVVNYAIDSWPCKADVLVYFEGINNRPHNSQVWPLFLESRWPHSAMGGSCYFTVDWTAIKIP